MSPRMDGLPNLGDPGTAFRFSAVVDGVHVAAFTEFTMPSLDVETMDITEGGQNAFVHKLPVRVKIGSAKLKHGVTETLDLLKWYVQVVQGDIAGAKREVSVILHGADHQPLITWSFRNAYPIRWSGPSLNSQDSSVAFEELEFVHHGFDVQAESWSYYGEPGQG